MEDQDAGSEEFSRNNPRMGMIPDQFDDPALKSALRQRFGGERAPEALRQRILKLVEDVGEGEVAGRIEPHVPTDVPTPARPAPPKALPLWRRGPTRLAAAILLFASGVVVYTVVTRDAGPRAANLAFPEVLAEMVKTHDYCCTHDNHQFPAIDQKNFAVMRGQVQERLKHPVVAASVEGWEFKGCYLCPVGEADSAHLLFARGKDMLSIFSVAAGGLKDEYSATEVEGHLVVAKVHKGTAFGVVAQPAAQKMSLPEVEELLRQHSASIAGVMRSGAILAAR